jgi:hypothetical protein
MRYRLSRAPIVEVGVDVDLPVWNGHSCPLLLTLILTLTLPTPTRKWVPHFSRPLREVGTTNACSIAVDVAVASSRAQPFFRRSEGSPAHRHTGLTSSLQPQKRVPHFSRPLREVGLLISIPSNHRGCPTFRVLCERWEPRTPAA